MVVHHAFIFHCVQLDYRGMGPLPSGLSSKWKLRKLTRVSYLVSDKHTYSIHTIVDDLLPRGSCTFAREETAMLHHGKPLTMMLFFVAL